MPTLYDVKPRFQALVRPVVRGLADAGVTANAVTIAACVLSFAYGVALLASGGAGVLLLGLPLVLLVRMALNAADGMLAREHGQASAIGGRLNEIGDVISDLSLYLPFAAFLQPGGPIVLAVTLGVLTEFAGVVRQAHGETRRYDGPLGKSDRALLFGLVAVVHAVFGLSPAAITAVFVLAAVAGAWTCFNRLFTEESHG